jgi:hypothetical protein
MGGVGAHRVQSQHNPLQMTDPSGMDCTDPNADVDVWYQNMWGTMAWDDFSNNYWAQGTGYSYGQFTSRQIAEAAKGWRENWRYMGGTSSSAPIVPASPSPGEARGTRHNER